MKPLLVRLPHRELQDQEIVALATSGDVAGAVEAIQRRYGAILLGYARSRVGREDAEDAVQSVMLGLISALGKGSFVLHSSLRSYLFAAVSHRLAEVHRLASREVERFAALKDARPTQGRAADVAASEREQLRALVRRVQELPQEQRTLFVLIHLDGLEPHQIARAAGSSQAATRQQLMRVRRSLRETLREHSAPES